MSETRTTDRTAELGDLFVSVTGDETVTQRQDEDGDNRAVPENEQYDEPEDGLDDALKGAEARPSADTG
jgi:hypothetical protein